MATELSCGVVPPMYREFYDVVCCNEDDILDSEMFVRILSSSGLSRSILLQVWDAVDNKQNCLSRTGLYRALALIALAQQGKSINVKLLDNFSDQELPKPNLGDLSDLRALSYIVRKERCPTRLGYTYQELSELDTILVTLVPERKGLILKHVEYEVTSQRWQSTVLRRYSDFIALQEILLNQFPYRVIPRLPPKKVIGTEGRDFIEQRRRALQRFLAIIARHPTLANGQTVKYFFTFKGVELHNKIKEHFRAVPDEFMLSPITGKAKELVSSDSTLEFAKSREHVRSLIDVLTRVRDIAERITVATNTYALDINQLCKELSALSTDPTIVTVWSDGTNESWKCVKREFQSVVPQFSCVIETVNQQAARLEERFADVISALLELLLAYKDLCERHDKGILADHQKTLQRLNQLRKKNNSLFRSSTSEAGAVEQLEARLLEQESEITNVENRSCFAMYCLQMETHLVYANVEALHVALKNLTDDERIAHCELAGAWAQICPMLSAFLPSSSAETQQANTALVRSHSLSTSHQIVNNNNTPVSLK